MSAPVDIVGQRFGFLTATTASPVRNARKQVVWDCLCDCGTRIESTVARLRSGNTTSCGCKRTASITTHGLHKTRAYGSWALMRSRCSDPKRADYYDRGIAVCKRWSRFENFYKDMGERPPGLTLDRKNNSRGYSPSNCRWATKEVQSQNRRTTRFIAFQGQRLCIAQWARQIGLHEDTLRRRLKQGWSISSALTTPVKGRK